METLIVNISGRLRRESLNGRDYLVAPMTLIVPGVLNGSQGALFYPPEEVAKDPGAWNGMPIVVYHPTKDGRPITARRPDVASKSTIGTVYNTFYNGKLVSEGWFDIDHTQRVDMRVWNSLVKRKPLELSTGLFTTNQPAQSGANYKGRRYDYIARNYRPDHLAVLPDQRGACSLQDGCGVLVNAFDESKIKRDDKGRFSESDAAFEESDKAVKASSINSKRHSRFEQRWENKNGYIGRINDLNEARKNYQSGIEDSGTDSDWVNLHADAADYHEKYAEGLKRAYSKNPFKMKSALEAHLKAANKHRSLTENNSEEVMKQELTRQSIEDMLALSDIVSNAYAHGYLDYADFGSSWERNRFGELLDISDSPYPLDLIENAARHWDESKVNRDGAGRFASSGGSGDGKEIHRVNLSFASSDKEIFKALYKDFLSREIDDLSSRFDRKDDPNPEPSKPSMGNRIGRALGRVAWWGVKTGAKGVGYTALGIGAGAIGATGAVIGGVGKGAGDLIKTTGLAAGGLVGTTIGSVGTAAAGAVGGAALTAGAGIASVGIGAASLALRGSGSLAWGLIRKASGLRFSPKKEGKEGGTTVIVNPSSTGGGSGESGNREAILRTADKINEQDRKINKLRKQLKKSKKNAKGDSLPVAPLVAAPEIPIAKPVPKVNAPYAPSKEYKTYAKKSPPSKESKTSAEKAVPKTKPPMTPTLEQLADANQNSSNAYKALSAAQRMSRKPKGEKTDLNSPQMKTKREAYAKAVKGFEEVIQQYESIGADPKIIEAHRKALASARKNAGLTTNAMGTVAIQIENNLREIMPRVKKLLANPAERKKFLKAVDIFNREMDKAGMPGNEELITNGWDESKHKRAKDGKFGEGGGQSPSNKYDPTGEATHGTITKRDGKVSAGHDDIRDLVPKMLTRGAGIVGGATGLTTLTGPLAGAAYTALSAGGTAPVAAALGAAAIGGPGALLIGIAGGVVAAKLAPFVAKAALSTGSKAMRFLWDTAKGTAQGVWEGATGQSPQQAPSAPMRGMARNALVSPPSPQPNLSQRVSQPQQPQQGKADPRQQQIMATLQKLLQDPMEMQKFQMAMKAVQRVVAANPGQVQKQSQPTQQPQPQMPMQAKQSVTQPVKV